MLARASSKTERYPARAANRAAARLFEGEGHDPHIISCLCRALVGNELAETNVYGETNPEYDGKLSDPRLAVPPAFSAKTEPEIALCDYPLGVITKQVAFSRHGSPHKIVTLANGKEGWVYEIPHERERKVTRAIGSSRGRDGVRQRVMHTYTLVFDDGVVIDVIYKDDGPGTGVTATEMQAHKMQPRAGAPIP